MALTLSTYVARVFCLAVLAMLLALSGLVSLFDFIELLRRSATKPDATFGIVAGIAGLRLPYVSMQILPFAVLLGGILAFWRLTRSSELIVARASGVSAWGFLAAPVGCAVLLGAVATGVVSPVSSAMLGRAEALDNAYLRTNGGPLALQGGQLWLRQSDRELDPQGVAIIHARSVTLRDGSLSGRDVSVFRLDGADRWLSRIESPRVTLDQGRWLLADARRMTAEHLPEPVGAMSLPTDLTVGHPPHVESRRQPRTRVLQQSGARRAHLRAHCRFFLSALHRLRARVRLDGCARTRRRRRCASRPVALAGNCSSVHFVLRIANRNSACGDID